LSPTGLSLGQRIEFKAADYEGAGLLSGMIGIEADRILKDPSGVRLDSGTEDLSVKGGVLRTTRTKLQFGRPETPTTMTLWTCEEIPGKLARFIREIQTGGAAYREDVRAVDFLSVKAEPAEIETLRAGRKPMPIEVTGMTFMGQECRFFDDSESLLKDWPGLKSALTAIVPGSSNTDWTGVNKKFIPFMEKARDLKKHLEEDQARAQAILTASEFEKLKLIWAAASRFIDVFLKSHEAMAYVTSLESGCQTQTELLDLLEELKTLRVDFDSARAQLGEEFKKLGAVKITYLR
jgi:hypothetical protein